jgi:hypothetical protein
MKTIIAGPREFSSYAAVCDAVRQSGFRITEVVSGCGPGVAALGARWAAITETPLKQFEPDRQRFGRIAGLTGNTEMVHYAEVVIAIKDKPVHRRTDDLIRKAKARGIPVYVHMVPCGGCDRQIM